MSVTNITNTYKVNESYLNLCVETKVVETVQQSYTFQVLSKHCKAKSVTFFSFVIKKIAFVLSMKARKNHKHREFNIHFSVFSVYKTWDT